MGERHTIKEVANMFGVSTDTLRLYEKEGLITPERDPENGYRYYDEETTQQIMGIIHYRRMGVSIKEIEALINCTDVDMIIKRCDGLIERTRSEIADLEAKMNRIEHISRHLGDIQNKYGQYYISEGGRYYIPKSGEGAVFNLHSLWTKESSPYLSFGHACFVLEELNEGEVEAKKQMIVITEEMWKISPFYETDKDVACVEIGPCVGTVITDRTPEREKVISNMRSFADGLGRKYKDYVYCMYVFSTGGLLNPVNYFELYLPLVD